MFVIIGIAIVIIGVLGGFVMHGGPLLVLLQWNEFLIIGGAALGSLLVGSPLPVLKRLVKNLLGILKGDKFTREQYIALMKTLFELFNTAKRDGLISVETHILEMCSEGFLDPGRIPNPVTRLPVIAIQENLGNLQPYQVRTSRI